MSASPPVQGLSRWARRMAWEVIFVPGVYFCSYATQGFGFHAWTACSPPDALVCPCGAGGHTMMVQPLSLQHEQRCTAMYSWCYCACGFPPLPPLSPHPGHPFLLTPYQNACPALPIHWDVNMIVRYKFSALCLKSPTQLYGIACKLACMPLLILTMPVSRVISCWAHTTC